MDMAPWTDFHELLILSAISPGHLTLNLIPTEHVFAAPSTPCHTQTITNQPGPFATACCTHACHTQQCPPVAPAELAVNSPLMATSLAPYVQGPAALPPLPPAAEGGWSRPLPLLLPLLSCRQPLQLTPAHINSSSREKEHPHIDLSTQKHLCNAFVMGYRMPTSHQHHCSLRLLPGSLGRETSCWCNHSTALDLVAAPTHLQAGRHTRLRQQGGTFLPAAAAQQQLLQHPRSSRAHTCRSQQHKQHGHAWGRPERPSGALQRGGQADTNQLAQAIVVSQQHRIELPALATMHSLTAVGCQALLPWHVRKYPDQQGSIHQQRSSPCCCCGEVLAVPCPPPALAAPSGPCCCCCIAVSSSSKPASLARTRAMASAAKPA